MHSGFVVQCLLNVFSTMYGCGTVINVFFLSTCKISRAICTSTCRKCSDIVCQMDKTAWITHVHYIHSKTSPINPDT